MDTFKKVVAVVANQLEMEEEKILLSTSFDDLDADSLDIVELIMSLEEEFDVQIPDEDVEKIKTVEDIVSYIDSHA